MITASGCAVPVVGALTVADLSTGASVTSTVLMGKGLAEHAADLLTGKDCRFIEGALRTDRAVCEPVGAAPTRKDFRGLIGIALDDNAPSSLFASRSVEATAGASSGAELRVAGKGQAGRR